jgi:hypothetical protein
MYAFSRDGAIPGSKFLCKVDRRWRSPNRCGPFLLPKEKNDITSADDYFFFLPVFGFVLSSVWLLCALSFIFALPHLGSTVAFNAVTSIAAFGLYISFGAHSNNSLRITPLAPLNKSTN